MMEGPHKVRVWGVLKKGKGEERKKGIKKNYKVKETKRTKRKKNVWAIKFIYV